MTSPPVFVDGFGARYHTVDPEAAEPGDPIEVLYFDQALVDEPEFGATLGRRVARLASVRHTLFARVRRLDRPAEDSLLLVSDRVPGWRLAHVLDVMEREQLSLDISAVLTLLRQLIPTVSLFARHQRELAVGNIGPEHLIVTPQGRLVVAEYVLGAAIEKLGLSREQLWRRYRVPATPGATKIWTRSDALAIGVVVLALLYGRRLREDEFPEHLGALLEAAQETSGGIVRPLSPKFSAWLGRALQLDSRTGFQSPQEAQVAFEEMLASERAYVTTPALLEAFITRFQALTAPVPVPVSEPEPEPEEWLPDPNGEEETDRLVLEQAIASVIAAPPVPPSFDFDSVAKPVAAEEAPATPRDSSLRARFETAVGGSARLFAALLVAVLVEALVIMWLWRDSPETLTGSGELVVRTQPPGATVAIDDKELGASPVTVRLAPGIYMLKVKLGTAERNYPVQISAGTQSVQYLELQNAR